MVFHLLRSAHKSVFHTGSTPFAILLQSLLDGVLTSSHIIQIQPDAYALFLAVCNQLLHIACLVSLRRIRIRFKLRTVPVGIQHQIFEALFGSEVNHPNPGRVRHRIFEAFPFRPVNTPIPQGDTRFHPGEVIRGIRVGVEKFY